MLLCWHSPMKEPVLQIRLKKQLSGGRVPHLLQRKQRGEEGVVSVGRRPGSVGQSASSVRFRSHPRPPRRIQKWQRGLTCVLTLSYKKHSNIFSLESRETTVYKWKVVLGGRGQTDSEMFFCQSEESQEIQTQDGKLSRRHGNINLSIANCCLHFSTQCGDISKGAEGSTAHNKSSSSCRGEEVDLPPTTQSLSRASVDSSDNKLCRAAAHRLSERTTREETQHIHLTYSDRTNCLAFEW